MARRTPAIISTCQFPRKIVRPAGPPAGGRRIAANLPRGFDVNRDGVADASGASGRIDYHRDPILTWPCFGGGRPGTAEYSSFARHCDDTRKALGAQLACRIDHRGFDEHYRLEARKTKQLNREPREPREPRDDCEAVFAVFQARVVAPSTLSDLANHPKVRQEFLSKLKGARARPR